MKPGASQNLSSTFTPIEDALGIGSRQAARNSMCSHFLFLMCADMQVASWLCPTEQNETRRLVISKIRCCVLLIHRACQQSPCAGKATSLTADGGKQNPFARRSIPEILILFAFKRAGAIRCFQEDSEAPARQSTVLQAGRDH
jgi:hypothetical protein